MYTWDGEIILSFFIVDTNEVALVVNKWDSKMFGMKWGVLRWI
jgi:hypothetical protein